MDKTGLWVWEEVPQVEWFVSVLILGAWCYVSINFPWTELDHG